MLPRGQPSGVAARNSCLCFFCLFTALVIANVSFHFEIIQVLNHKTFVLSYISFLFNGSQITI